MLKDINSLPNFHTSDDAIISVFTRDMRLQRSSSPTSREASVFGQAASLKRKKPLHVYGRKSGSGNRLVDSPSKQQTSFLLPFRQLLEESAEEREIESSSSVPAKRVKAGQILPEKPARRERTTSAGLKNGRKPLQMAIAGAQSLQRQAAMPIIEVNVKHKKPYQFRRPFPLQVLQKDSSRTAATRISDSTHHPGLGLAPEATEIIEDYSDMSGITAVEGFEITTLAFAGTSRQIRERITETRHGDTANASADPRQDVWNFDTGPLPSVADLEMLPANLDASKTSFSTSITSLQMPTAAQRAASTSRASTISAEAWLAPNITVTMPTSPPGVSGTPAIVSSPMAFIPTPALAQFSHFGADAGLRISLAAFLQLAVPQMAFRPPPPPVLPFRSLSRHIEPAEIIELLAHGESNGVDQYMVPGRRGWWVLPLQSPQTFKSASQTSTAIVLGLGGDLAPVKHGTIVWTLPRVQLLFKQIAAMSATRKWGMLDILPVPAGTRSANLHITCPAHLGLQLRTVLSEMACKLDREGEELSEPARADMPASQIGKMWLGAGSGVNLEWWDETDRTAVLIA